jgi:hypothetical protein
MLRGLFGLRRHEMTADKTELNEEEFYNVYSSFSLINTEMLDVIIDWT